jgi:putative addiction module component (TIGR02574 family)
MSKKQLLAAILKLPVDERVELLNEVEQRTSDECERLPHETPEFLAELDRRYKRFLRDPSRAYTWEQVSAEMKATIQKVRDSRSTSSSKPRPRATSSKPRLTTRTNRKV